MKNFIYSWTLSFHLNIVTGLPSCCVFEEHTYDWWQTIIRLFGLNSEDDVSELETCEVHDHLKCEVDLLQYSLGFLLQPVQTLKSLHTFTSPFNTQWPTHTNCRGNLNFILEIGRLTELSPSRLNIISLNMLLKCCQSTFNSEENVLFVVVVV